MEYKRDLFKGNDKSVFRLILGFAFLVISILWIISKISENELIKPFDWLYSIVFALNGVAHIFAGLGTSIERFFGKSFVNIDNDSISFKFGAFEKEKVTNWQDILSIVYVPHHLTIQMRDNSTKMFSLTKLDSSCILDIKETISKIATLKKIELVIN